jgi:hypothetical protein
MHWFAPNSESLFTETRKRAQWGQNPGRCFLNSIPGEDFSGIRKLSTTQERRQGKIYSLRRGCNPNWGRKTENCSGFNKTVEVFRVRAPVKVVSLARDLNAVFRLHWMAGTVQNPPWEPEISSEPKKFMHGVLIDGWVIIKLRYTNWRRLTSNCVRRSLYTAKWKCWCGKRPSVSRYCASSCLESLK